MGEFPPFIAERDLLDAIGEAVVVLDAAGVIRFWNRAAEQLYGWTREEALDRVAATLLLADERDEVRDRITAELASTGGWSGDIVAHRKDGTGFESSVTISGVRDTGGELAGFVAVARDVSDRARVERELRATSQRLALALEAGQMGTMWSDGERAHWDERMEAMFGLEPGAFSGQPEHAIELVHPEDRDQLVTNVRATFDDESPFVEEHRVIWPDGSVHWVERRGRRSTDPHTGIATLVGVAINIDERKEREKLLELYQNDVDRMYRRLQRGLMPSFEIDDRFIVESLYQGGEQRLLLGGDFYDAVSLDDGSLALVVGDVSGHGADAAAVGARLRAAWRALALQHSRPAEMVGVLDQLVRHEAPEAEMFATLEIVVVSADGRRASVTVAGHPAPLLAVDTAVLEIEVEPRPPLGMSFAPAPSTFVDLPHAWSLLLYTDGIVEGRAEPGSSARYGVDRLVADAQATGLSPVRSALECLLDHAEAANGGPLADDVALLCVAPARGR